LTETAVRDWVKQAERDTGTRTDGLTSDERADLAVPGHQVRSCSGEPIELAGPLGTLALGLVCARPEGSATLDRARDRWQAAHLPHPDGLVLARSVSEHGLN
jgi:hypothetical protein